MEPVKTQSSSVPIKFYGERNLYGEFSNFYKAEIVIDGKTWPTTEHYFQAQKYAGINEDYLEKIRTCKTPGEAKRVAREVGITRRSDWSDVKYYVMLEALEAKFTQHLDLKKKLLDTGNKELIENAPHDYQWGCGADGTGKNWLGKALMEVRELLQQQEAEKSKKAQ